MIIWGLVVVCTLKKDKVAKTDSSDEGSIQKDSTLAIMDHELKSNSSIHSDSDDGQELEFGSTPNFDLIIRVASIYSRKSDKTNGNQEFDIDRELSLFHSYPIFDHDDSLFNLESQNLGLDSNDKTHFSIPNSSSHDLEDPILPNKMEESTPPMSDERRDDSNTNNSQPTGISGEIIDSPQRLNSVIKGDRVLHHLSKPVNSKEQPFLPESPETSLTNPPNIRNASQHSNNYSHAMEQPEHIITDDTQSSEEDSLDVASSHSHTEVATPVLNGLLGLNSSDTDDESSVSEIDLSSRNKSINPENSQAKLKPLETNSVFQDNGYLARYGPRFPYRIFLEKCTSKSYPDEELRIFLSNLDKYEAKKEINIRIEQEVEIYLPGEIEKVLHQIPANYDEKKAVLPLFTDAFGLGIYRGAYVPVAGKVLVLNKTDPINQMVDNHSSSPIPNVASIVAKYEYKKGVEWKENILKLLGDLVVANIVFIECNEWPNLGTFDFGQSMVCNPTNLLFAAVQIVETAVQLFYSGLERKERAHLSRGYIESLLNFEKRSEISYIYEVSKPLKSFEDVKWRFGIVGGVDDPRNWVTNGSSIVFENFTKCKLREDDHVLNFDCLEEWFSGKITQWRGTAVDDGQSPEFLNHTENTFHDLIEKTKRLVHIFSNPSIDNEGTLKYSEVADENIEFFGDILYGASQGD